MSDSPRAAIRGVGSAVPDRVLTNADLEKLVETNDEWITKRTGIKERRIVGEGESTATLAIAASQRALADAGLTAADLDLIIGATVTPEMIFPATACFVQEALGAGDTPAFDISAACSGFAYGLSVADKFIRTGTYKRILVVAADALSRFTDYTDRGTCILFGDGAGAVVLEPTTDPDRGILYTVMHASGAGWDFIHIPAGGARTPASHETVDQRGHYIHMQGRDVYKFAVEKMQWLLGDCMSQCNLTVDDVDLVIPHQVNLRIIQSAAQKHNFPMEKVYINIDRFGNTSGSSVGIALDEARSQGLVGKGSTILVATFGAGLTWAGAVIRL